MKTVISMAPLLACAFSLNAQITATLNRFPARSSEIGIRNNSAVSLAAFAIGMAPVAQDAPNSAPLLVYVDTAVDQTAMPLLPSQEYTVPVPSRFRPGQPGEDLFEPPIVTAAIFADGATTGDAALLRRLILRRCNMQQAVEAALEMLSDAGGHNVPRGQLIEQFSKMADSLNHWYLPQEQQVGRSLYQSIIGKLKNLPEGPLGSPFPPTAFVEEETAMLRQRRATLVESRPSLEDASRMGR
jgi:hypothetical protein